MFSLWSFTAVEVHDACYASICVLKIICVWRKQVVLYQFQWCVAFKVIMNKMLFVIINALLASCWGYTDWQRIYPWLAKNISLFTYIVWPNMLCLLCGVLLFVEIRDTCYSSISCILKIVYICTKNGGSILISTLS